jgi:hypothetical protein
MRCGEGGLAGPFGNSTARGSAGLCVKRETADGSRQQSTVDS